MKDYPEDNIYQCETHGTYDARLPVSEDTFRLAKPEQRPHLVVRNDNLPTQPDNATSMKAQARKKDAQAIIAESMSEEDLQKNIIAMAKQFGWLIHSERPALTKEGQWRTPIQGDKGFYDLILKRYTPNRGYETLEWELKSEKGKLSEAQEAWFAVSPSTEVIRPSDWLSGRVEKRLRGDL